MSTVRCPSCERALSLPEASDAATAKCPLCGRVFDVPARAPPASPGLPSPPSGIQIDPSPLPPAIHHFQDDHQEPFLPAADQRAVDSAAGWLRAAGMLGALHLIFCDCFSACLAVSQSNESVVLLLFFSAWLFEGAISLTAYNAAGSLDVLRSRSLVRAAGVLCLVMVLLEALMAAPVVLALAEAAGAGARNRFALGNCVALAVFLLFDVTLILAFLVAGFKALDAQSRPDVRARFER
jgi:hypothetical protein